MDKTPDSKAVALLERAHELMNEEGRHWIKGNYRRTIGTLKNGEDEFGYCSVGALEAALTEQYGKPDRIGLAVDYYEPYYGALSALGEVIRPGDAGGSGTVISFNDNPKTTWTDVSTTFKAAIARLRGK